MPLKSIYGIDVTLRESIARIPSCLQEDSLETLLAKVQSGKSEIIAIVNSQQFPIGIIDCNSLLCLFNQCDQGVTTSLARESLSDRPIGSLSVKQLDTLIKPATILKSSITIRELLPYFSQDSLGIPQTKTYLIVNSQGQLLGSLDTAKVLRHLLSGEPTQLPTLTIDRHLVDFLEVITLPVQLQAEDGRVVYQNDRWRKLAGELLSESNPIAQWWLKQQQPPLSLDNDHFKASYMASPPTSPQLTEPCKYSSDLLPDRGERLLPLEIPEVSVDWNYIQIPINLVSQKQKLHSTELPCYQIVVALPSSATNAVAEFSDAELIELNRLKDELLASISHELKSPLTGIVGLSSLLKENKLGSLNQRQLRYAELIYRSGRQSLDLVSDLLDLSNLTSGKLQLNLEPIDLNLFCQEVYQQVLGKLTANTSANAKIFADKSIQLNVAPNSSSAIADKLRLRQILSHLLTDSLKKSQPQHKIGIDISSQGNWLTITIWNSSVGSEVKQRSLLEIKTNPTNQTSESINSVASSNSENFLPESEMSLSCTIARQLAKAHGGEISSLSKIGWGSEFTLLLPARYPRSDSAVASASLTPADSNSLVLLVETQTEQIERMTAWLRELGYYPVVARSGTEALQKARRLQPSYILLNPTLPLLSGKDLLTLLRSDSRTSDCSVLIICADESISEDNSYRLADRFIFPLNKMDLAAVLPSVEQESVGGLTLNKTLISPRSLTILCLYPEPEFIDSTEIEGRNNSNFNLKDWAERDWEKSSDRYDYRIIEADGLEQANMLSRIWDLDTIVLDGSGLKEPLTYLRSLRQFPDLTALPLVILDPATTEAANQIQGLSIYPCLIPAKSRSTLELMQVIQIAARIDNR
jgi:signal transduction histidine kinase/CheY-like chemotaxis protein